MGRPFATELEGLQATYHWALREPVTELARALDTFRDIPLLAVGSGGSFTAAHFAADIHQQFTGKLSEALTPLQLVGSPARLRDMAVLLPTAAGKNPDVLGAFKYLVSVEPKRLAIWCAAKNSPLSRLASKYDFVDRLEVAIPHGKDGFLAVHSLLSFEILLARAYCESFGVPLALPPSLEGFFVSAEWATSASLDQRLRSLWSRRTLTVLHGPATRTVAIDLESKFTEAALGVVQCADYRQFAHGRHHWLAKRPGESAILAFLTPDDRRLGERTLSLLPKNIPALHVDLEHTGWRGAIAGLIHCFHIVGSAGRARGVDPGRPGVPSFGRRLYHLNAFSNGQHFDLPAAERLAIERKSGIAASMLNQRGSLGVWRQAYTATMDRLTETPFIGIVADYDGTLCDESERFAPLPRGVAAHFIRLLRSNVVIGIASGRGKSVRESLQKRISEKYWQQILIGYYNGSDVGTLSDNARPDRSEVVVPELEPIQTQLVNDTWLAVRVDVTFRRKQITVSPRHGSSLLEIWERVHSLLMRLPFSGAMALRSGHSVDIVAPGVSKLAVVDHLRDVVGNANGVVLTIGDRGQWPGNDFALLNSPHSLSVDEVPQDPLGAWNMAPAGWRGKQACLHYLQALRAVKGIVTLQHQRLMQGGDT